MTGPPPLADTIAAFDARSSTYDDSRMHHAFAAAAVQAAAPRAGQTLLDVAGGTGLAARKALPHLKAAVVLDASAGMLHEARRQEPRLHLVRADGHHLPLPEASVDRVTCITALHLFHDPSRALAEMARTCRPDGRIVFTTWAAQGWRLSRALRRAAAAEGVHVPNAYAQTGTADAVRALAAGSGLRTYDVASVRHEEPLADRATAWARVTARQPVPERVRVRFERELPDVDEHVVLLVTCGPIR